MLKLDGDSDGRVMADPKRSKAGWIYIGIKSGFAIGMPGGFEVGSSGGFDRNLLL